MTARGDDIKEDTPDAFERGLALFNRGKFFACHEVWEELWLGSIGAEKLFYQGLIQAAVALLHAERGNRRGASSTWRKAQAKLDALPAAHHGVALGEFRDALAEFFAHALDRDGRRGLPPRPKIRRRV
jgi:predicted metal-dependent hydrolase